MLVYVINVVSFFLQKELSFEQKFVSNLPFRLASFVLGFAAQGKAV